jgi:hypothetical protein
VEPDQTITTTLKWGQITMSLPVAPQTFDRGGQPVYFEGGAEQVYMEPDMRGQLQPVAVYSLDPDTGVVARVDSTHSVVSPDVLSGDTTQDLLTAAGVGLAGGN